MTINTDTILNQTMLNSLSVKTKEASSTTEFESELQRQLMDNLKSQNVEKEVQSDAAVEEFKWELSSIGALGFLQSFNLEKIEELIEKKKEELMEALGLSDKTQPPLSAQERTTALQTLEDLLADYKKELLEKTQAEAKLEKNNTALSSVLQNF